MSIVLSNTEQIWFSKTLNQGLASLVSAPSSVTKLAHNTLSASTFLAVCYPSMQSTIYDISLVNMTHMERVKTADGSTLVNIALFSRVQMLVLSKYYCSHVWTSITRYGRTCHKSHRDDRFSLTPEGRVYAGTAYPSINFVSKLVR